MVVADLAAALVPVAGLAAALVAVAELIAALVAVAGLRAALAMSGWRFVGLVGGRTTETAHVSRSARWSIQIGNTESYASVGVQVPPHM